MRALFSGIRESVFGKDSDVAEDHSAGCKSCACDADKFSCIVPVVAC